MHKLNSAGLSVPLCSYVMAHGTVMHGLTSAGLSVPLCSCVMAHWNSDAQADQRWLICAFVFMCHGSLGQ